MKGVVFNLLEEAVEAVHGEYPGAHSPAFRFGNGSDGALPLGYRSPRRLCRLAEGFIEGVALHYGKTAAVTDVRCMHDGHPDCLMLVDLAR